MRAQIGNGGAIGHLFRVHADFHNGGLAGCERALDCGLRVRLVYRREVCSVLDVSKGGKDAQVRQRMIEMHPGGCGTKKAPGPLYGVSSHAWQALGLAVAVTLLPEEP